MFVLNGTAPIAPAGLSVSDQGGGRAKLRWTPMPGATSYNIKRATSPGGPFHTLAQTPEASGATVEYVDANLFDNQDYYYVISTINIYGESPDSASVCVSIIIDTAPKITPQPVAQSAECGTPITLAVSTAGNGLAYQWMNECVEITNASSPTLLLAGTPSDDGVYRVRVTGKNGVTLSDPAQITITPDGNSPLRAPASLTVDAAGIIYVSDEDNHVVHVLTPPGNVSVYTNTFAGNPGVSGMVDATGTQAKLNHPADIVTRSGTLYVADFANSRLRVISTGREVGTHPAGDVGGVAGITTDARGNIYVSDKTAHVICKIDAATGAQSVIAGQWNHPGAADGSGTAAQFSTPLGIAHASGTGAGGTLYNILYIADAGNHIIRKIDLGNDNQVSTHAGVAGAPGCADGVGDDALFNRPEGIIVDGVGILYVADAGNSIIREITHDGTVSTVAGDRGVAGFKDATGADARFNNPRGVALSHDGEFLYIADTGNRAVRRIDSGNKVQTLLALTASGTNTEPPMDLPDIPGSDGGGGGAPSAWYLCHYPRYSFSDCVGCSIQNK